MKKMTTCLLGTALLFATGVCHAADYYLRAAKVTNTMPDGIHVVMWGFAQEDSFGSATGMVTVPGPKLTVPPGDSTLRIHLKNELPEPVSIVIPSLSSADLTAVRNPDGRARSFTKETPPGNASEVVYTWSHLKPGTHLYHSGSHPAIQVQMGLYGAVTARTPDNRVYNGIACDSEVTLLYSEIDPAVHTAVANDDFGPGKAMTSTIRSRPSYFLINGLSYATGQSPILAGAPGRINLIRFINASLDSHIPILDGFHLRLIAEDGNPYPYPKNMYSVNLPPLKTIDALFSAPSVGTHPLYDRRLGLVSGRNSPGGMLAYLAIATAPTIAVELTENPETFRITVTSDPGSVVVIESAPAVSAPAAWTTFTTITNATGTFTQLFANNLSSPATFYKARLSQ